MRALAAQTAALLTLALTAALNATTTTTTNNPSTLTILPLPRTSEITTTPPITNITYHQGLVHGGNSAASSPGPCGGLEVSKGLLTAGYCVELATYAVSVKRMQGLECVFRLFKGSDGCRWDADEMVSWIFLLFFDFAWTSRSGLMVLVIGECGLSSRGCCCRALFSLEKKSRWLADMFCCSALGEYRHP